VRRSSSAGFLGVPLWHQRAHRLTADSAFERTELDDISPGEGTLLRSMIHPNELSGLYRAQLRKLKTWIVQAKSYGARRIKWNLLTWSAKGSNVTSVAAEKANLLQKRDAKPRDSLS
jgi:hypothetical protein